MTSAGLELYEHVRQGLGYLDTKRHVITWFKYAHETRIVVLGVSPNGFRVQPYQLVSRGVIKLPPFDLLDDYKSAYVSNPPSRLLLDKVRLVRMYSRVYCCHQINV